MDTVRTFIALEVNDEFRQAIQKVQSHLKRIKADIVWVQPENMHLTIKFLGDVPMEKIDSIADTQKATCANVKPFTIELSEIGTFPDLNFPQIIWAGINKKDQTLENLVGDLENNLAQLGFAREKRAFTAHITVGRVKSKEDLFELSKALSQLAPLPKIQQTIKHITLFKSTLTNQEPTYTILSRIPLIIHKN